MKSAKFFTILALIFCIAAKLSPVSGDWLQDISDKVAHEANKVAQEIKNEGLQKVAQELAAKLKEEGQKVADDVAHRTNQLKNLILGDKKPSTEYSGIAYIRTGDFWMGVRAGEVTTPEKYPRLVAIFNSTSGKLVCGGILITNRHILTAAHCVIHKPRRDLYVQLSHSIHNSRTVENIKKYEIDLIHTHDMYSYDRHTQTVESDIAILKLKDTIQFADGDNHTLGLPKVSTSFVGVNATVAGFGSAGDGLIDPSPTLREAMVPIWDNADCSIRYRGRSMPESVVCAGFDKPGADACHGDSGGPLVVREPNSSSVLVGIISHGVDCGTGYPGVYTRVSAYLDWIKKMTAD